MNAVDAGQLVQFGHWMIVAACLYAFGIVLSSVDGLWRWRRERRSFAVLLANLAGVVEAFEAEGRRSRRFLELQEARRAIRRAREARLSIDCSRDGAEFQIAVARVLDAARTGYEDERELEAAIRELLGRRDSDDGASL